MNEDFIDNYIIQNRLDNWTKDKVEKEIELKKTLHKDQYYENLNDINWIEKRKEILKRDNNKCLNCNNKQNLHIHHLLYFNNKKAWEYDNEYLVTLCGNCHENEHKKHGTGNFKRYIEFNKIINN